MVRTGGLITGVINLVIGIIMLLNVAVPTSSTAVNDANLTGTSATIANLYPLFLVIGGLLLITSLYS